jgi:predicted nucleotidyltransferase
MTGDTMATHLPISLEELRRRREEILAIAKRRGVTDVRVFGSVVSGLADAQSDIDLLVTLERGRSLIDLAGLRLDLQEYLGCSVDVATEAGLRPRIRPEVLRTAQRL